MILAPHMLIGAAIGAKIKNIGWIIVLGLLSHFILDKIPHWDYGEKLEEMPRDKYFKKNLFIELLEIGIDGLLGLTIVCIIIWQKNMIKIEYLIFILTGILVSILPDIVLGVSKLLYVYNKFKKISKNYIDFHRKFFHNPKHIRKPTLIGLGAEIIVSIIAILILLI